MSGSLSIRQPRLRHETPLIARNPGGPESRAMSFHFSYRFRISRGTAPESCFVDPAMFLDAPHTLLCQYHMVCQERSLLRHNVAIEPRR